MTQTSGVTRNQHPSNGQSVKTADRMADAQVEQEATLSWKCLENMHAEPDTMIHNSLRGQVCLLSC